MPRKINLVNQVFNRLTVLEDSKQRSKSGSVLWKCQCECGNITLSTGSELKSGHKKSCGCLHKEQITELGKQNLINLSGQKFDKLTVLEKVSSKKSPSGTTKIFWLCKCDCGNQCIIEGNALKTGNTRSCGCIKSFGEQKIISLLQQYGIPFEKEKYLNPKSQYRYDFYVNDSYIIEYDGKQHFQDYSWGSESHSLIESQKRDMEKNEFCWTNNIPIIRIPYTHYNKLTIEDLLLETSTFIFNKENNK